MTGRFGRYEVRGILGRGGMGEVHRAWDPQLQREVALKVIPLASSEAQIRARFLAEARALARVTAPQVVMVYDLDITLDPPFLVMELIEGPSLHRLRANGLSFNANQIADCAGQVLRGLAAAHAAGVLHRDLKPGNILRNSVGMYKLVDFGLAMLAAGNERLTGDMEVVGTLRYLAPEVAEGAEHSIRSDLFGLGATLIELATGKPVHGEAQGAVLLARVVQGLGSVATLLPDLPEDLQQFIARLVAKDPEQRFASAAEALTALDGLALGTMVPASPSTSGAVPLSPLSPLSAHDGPTEVKVSPSSGSSVSTIRPVHQVQQSDGVESEPNKVNFSYSTKLTLALWLLSSLGMAVVGFVQHRYSLGLQMDGLRNELQISASTAALLIDPLVLDRIHKPEDMKDPGYAAVRDRMRLVQQQNPGLRFIYTMRQLPETAKTGIVEFVIDAQETKDLDGNGVIDENEEAAPPGKTYQSRVSPHLLEGFTKLVTEDTCYTDPWGTLISGYAPIKRADGTVAGLVGVDIDAGRIAALERASWQQMLVLQGLLLVAFLAAAQLIARRFDRPVQRLRHAMLAIANGDLDAELPGGRDEFGLLSKTLGQVAEELRTATQMRAALERVLTGSLAGRAPEHPGSVGAVLHLQVGLRHEGGLPALQRCLPVVVDAIHELGGTVEGVAGRGLLARFPDLGAGDAPGERALRAGIAALAAIGLEALDLEAGGAVACGDIDAAARRARQMISAGRGTADLLAEAELWPVVRRHFYADQINLPNFPGVLAIKGAVAG